MTECRPFRLLFQKAKYIGAYLAANTSQPRPCKACLRQALTIVHTLSLLKRLFRDDKGVMNRFVLTNDVFVIEIADSSAQTMKERKTCTNCFGSGEQDNTMPDDLIPHKETCPLCDGKGYHEI